MKIQLLLSILTGIICLLVMMIIFNRAALTPKKKKTRLGQSKDAPVIDPWIRYYKLLFGRKSAESVARAIGMDYNQIITYIKTIKSPKTIEYYIMMRMFGFAVVAMSFVLMALGVSYIVVTLGAIGYIVLGMYPTNKLEKAVKEHRREIENELPRFLDLVKVNTELGRPIVVAIEGMAKLVPGPVSAEFTEAMEEARIGKCGWQEALEHMAAKNNIDTLSDFVNELIIASNKGTSVSAVLGQKADAIRQIRLNRVREKAGKMSSLIMMPLAIFKLLPLIGLVLLPVVIQIFRSL